MPAVSGSPTQCKTSVATAVDLAGVPDDAFATGDFAAVIALMPNGTFRLNRAGAGTPDNISIIGTFSGNGVWEVFESASAGFISVDNIAALELVPTSLLESGMPAWVESLRTYFRLAPVDASAPVDVMIVPALDGGNWLRDVNYTDTWGSQDMWEIDADNGDDESSGLPGFPIATFAELARRLRGAYLAVAREVTVSVLSDIPASDPPDFSGLAAGSYIIVTGDDGATVLGTGTITAVQAIAPATNDHLEIEASGLAASWTASGYMYRAVRITTAGARLGSVMFAAYDLGTVNRRARMTNLVDDVAAVFPTFITPLVADTFEVLDLPVIGSQPVVPTGVQVNYALLEFKTDFSYLYGRGFGGPSSGTIFTACAFSPDTDGGTFVVDIGFTYINGGLFYSTNSDYCEIDLYPGSDFNARGVGFVSIDGAGGGTAALNPYKGSQFALTNSCLLQNAGNFGNFNGVFAYLDTIGIYNQFYKPFIIGTGTKLQIESYVYGENNAAEIVTMESYAIATYSVLARLVATGSVSPVIFRGLAAIAWATLPFVDTATPARTQAGFVLET